MGTLQPDLSNEPAEKESEVESTEQVSQELSEEQSSEQAAAQEAAALDLNSVQKFTWEGKEYTPSQLKEWRDGYMRNDDYTRKSQEIAEYRRDSKYWSNLDTDLDNVRRNPQLAEQFKSIYPKSFHNFLRHVASETQQLPEIKGMDPQFVKRFTEVESKLIKQEEATAAQEAAAKAREVETLTEKLGVIASQMTKKYPMAAETEALAIAESLHQQGKEINTKAWDEIYKTIHDRNKGLAESYLKSNQTKQVSANKKARDTASGGGVPGQAPREFKTIKEATNAMLNDAEI